REDAARGIRPGDREIHGERRRVARRPPRGLHERDYAPLERRVACDERGCRADAGAGAKSCFNLSQLDAMPSNLDLEVFPTQELDLAGGQISALVAGSIEALPQLLVDEEP